MALTSRLLPTQVFPIFHFGIMDDVRPAVTGGEHERGLIVDHTYYPLRGTRAISERNQHFCEGIVSCS